MSGRLLQKLQKIYLDQPGLIGEHWASALWVHSEDRSNNSWNRLSSLGIQLSFCSSLCLAKFCDRCSVLLSQWVQQTTLVNRIFVYVLFFPLYFSYECFMAITVFRGGSSKAPCETGSWERDFLLCLQHLQKLRSWQIIRNVSWLISVISLLGCQHQTECASSDSAAYLTGRLSEQHPRLLPELFLERGLFLACLS